MIEFRAFLGEHGGLHFVCVQSSGGAVAEELLRLDCLSREITGMGIGGYGEVLSGEAYVNPMVVLALIAEGHMSSRVNAERVELYTRDPRDPDNPAARIFQGARLKEVTVAVCFSGPDKEQ